MAIALIKRYSHVGRRSDAQFIKQVVQDYDEYQDVIQSIIEEEKDNMCFPYEDEHYEENYSDHYWEAGSCMENERWYIRYEFEYIDLSDSCGILEDQIDDLVLKLIGWVEEDLECSDA